MANALDVTIAHFFEEMPAAVEKQTPSELMRTKQRPANDPEADPLAKRDQTARRPEAGV
jgi:hypothetical protein